MIQSFQRCLHKVVGRAKFSYDEIHIAIVEIEAIVNNRPLSYIHPDDLEQPLMHSHLLVGRTLLSLPDYLNHLEPEDDADFELRAVTSKANQVSQQFDKPFLEEMRTRVSSQPERQSPPAKTQGFQW